ncbi:unnamed protein product [Closterium sp. NIES-53]
MCTRTGRHLATFTRRPGSSLYTLATAPSQVAASAQVSASGQVTASCSCRLLLHQTLLWNHRLGHPSLPRLRGMHSRLLVSGLLRSLPPLPPSPTPPCLPCVEGRQCAAPHSSSFPPTTAPLQILHMDVWGPARVSGQDRECYFLLVVDDCTRYTTVFPLRNKGQVVDVLIPWIRTVRLQLRERFGQDLPVMRLHSDRGGEFSSTSCGTFVRCIGVVVEVARTSMIHAAAPHFLWPFAARYAAHQLNLWPRVSLPETSPTLRWTGEVGDASVFRVWGSRAFVRDTSADKLSARAIPCIFLGFVPDAPGWQFHHPTSRHVFPSQDAKFDESVPFYISLPLSLCPSPAPAALPCSRVRSLGVRSLRVLRLGVLSLGVLSVEVLRLGVVSLGVLRWRVRSLEVRSLRVLLRLEFLLVLRRDCLCSSCVSVRRTRLRSGASGARGADAAGAGGTGVAARAGVPGGTATTGPGGARTRGTRAAGTGGVEGAGFGDLTESGPTGAGGAGARGAGVGGPGAGGTGVGGAGAGGAGAFDLGGPCPPPDQSQPPLQLASPLTAPSPYTEQPGGLKERREHASRPVSPVRTTRRVPRSCSPPVPGMHAMALCRSSVPLRVPLLAPLESSLPEVPDLESDRARTASPTVSRLLATAVTDPSFESISASALVAELLDFAAACRLDYASALVAESAPASPTSVGGECALDKDVLEDRQEDLESLAAAVPRFASMLLAPEGDPDAPDIPNPRSYAEAITGTYVDEFPPPGANIVDGMWIFSVKRPPGSPPAFKARYVARGFSQQQGRDYELHSLDFSTAFLQSSLHEEIGLRRPPGFTGSFPAGTQWSLRRPVCGLCQVPREWHDTLRTTLAVLGFAPSTANPSLFLRTDTSLPPFYVLVYVLQRFGFQFSSPQLTPLSTSHSRSAPPLDESVEPSGPYPELVGCLIYLMTCTRPDLVYPLSLLARYVGPGRHRKVHWDAAKRVLRYLCSTSGMGLVLGGRGPVVLTGHADASWVDDSAKQRSSQGYTCSLGSGSISWRSTCSSSVLSSSCEADIYVGAMAAQELRWLTYLLTDLGEQPRSPPVLYVDNKAMIALCQEHRTKHIALRYFLARELQQRGQLRLAYVAIRANTADVFTKALSLSDHQRFVTVLGLVPTLPHMLIA